MKKNKLSIEEKINIIEYSSGLENITLSALPDIHNSSYFFVSYSHLDYKKVYTDILLLQQEGINIWYDRGLPAGRDWKEIASEYINKFACVGVIFYLSENSLKSNAVFDEIEEFYKTGKDFLAIMLPTSDTNEILSPLKLFDKIYQGENQKGRELIEKLFGERKIFVSFFSNPQQKAEKIKNLKIPTLVKYKPKEDYAVVSGINDTNVKTVEISKNVTFTKRDYQALESLNLQLKTIEESSIKNQTGGLFYNEGRFSELDKMYFDKRYETPTYIKKEDDNKVYSVTEIEENSFSNCVNLEKVTLPKTLKVINFGAFSLCKRLSNINLKNIRIFNDNAFYKCDSLKELKLESAYYCGEKAFYSCKNLESVDFSRSKNSESLSKIRESCFAECSYLKNVTFDSNSQVKVIERNAFSQCNNLKEITLPLSVERIEEGAFRWTGIEKFSVEKGSFSLLSKIENYAFEGCFNLKSIDLSSCYYLRELNGKIFASKNENGSRLFACLTELHISDSIEVITQFPQLYNLTIYYGGTIAQFKKIRQIAKDISIHDDHYFYLEEGRSLKKEQRIEYKVKKVICKNGEFIPTPLNV